jgi:hypothetical protein
MPYWEDWVHRDFDPIADSYGKGGFSNSLFAHEIFSPPPYDGVLVSLGMFELKLRLIRLNGAPSIRGFTKIKEYLRLPKNFPVLGDCGAFTYVNSKEQKLSVPHAVELYHKLGFDYGISVDHICSETVTVEEKEAELFKYKEAKKTKGGKVKLTLSEEELEERRELSLKNAEEFLKLSRKTSFVPVGAVQGYSIETYLDSFKKLLEMGYSYLAVGGLVPRSSAFIKELLKELSGKFDLSRVKVHLLGVLREELLNEMASCGVYSFDSASYYRKAWLKAKQNYLGVDGNWYASIRVPDPFSGRLKNKLLGKALDLGELKERERRILKALRDYDRGNLKELSALLEEVISYDELFFREEFKADKYYQLYKNLLESKIWKECSCPVCRELGIDVVIFRGSNRNKRRGFHNTYLFYRSLMACDFLPSL